jgi:hypothetical protein
MAQVFIPSDIWLKNHASMQARGALDVPPSLYDIYMMCHTIYACWTNTYLFFAFIAAESGHAMYMMYIFSRSLYESSLLAFRRLSSLCSGNLPIKPQKLCLSCNCLWCVRKMANSHAPMELACVAQ